MALQRKVKWFFTLIVLANIVLLLIVILGAFEPPPPKPMPNPNGYDDFVKAGELLTGEASDFAEMRQEELAALVSTNAEALKLVRVGLNRECRVPNDYSDTYIERLLLELISQKKLVFNLCAQGRMEELQHRTNDAAQTYLDAVSFGELCSQGGVLVSKFLGIACESIGRSRLQSLTNSLDSHHSRKIAQTLETLDANELPKEDVLEHERAFVRKASTLWEKIKALINSKEQRTLRSNFVNKFQNNQLARRQLMINFAARAYELEKGHPPATITNLVPDYLKSVPHDPATGTNLTLP